MRKSSWCTGFSRNEQPIAAATGRNEGHAAYATAFSRNEQPIAAATACQAGHKRLGRN
jgi:hypothetical protein